MSALEVDREQALAFRVAGHNLHKRTDPLTAIAACGLQEYPPGWSGVALQARAKGERKPSLVVTVNAMRGAPYVVPRTDAAVFTLALVPDDKGLKALLGSQTTKEVGEAGYTPRQALDLVAKAARKGLTNGPLERDDFHQMFREELPQELLPWCRNCQSHHVRPGLWRTLGPLGVTEMPAKATYVLAEQPRMALAKARADLARRFLRCYGPATAAQLVSWAQTAAAHAKAIFAQIEDELEQVKLEGTKAWLLAADLRRLKDPPAARGVRLIGGHDPYVAQPDRESLAPDQKLRKRMFPAIGRPGVALFGGELVGLWKGRKKGKVLEVEIDWIGDPVDVAREAAAVAPLRGCETARISG